MKEKKLIPLKITTEYSLLKSLIKLPDLISFLLENNIKECAICDENLNGFMDFYLKCKENNIKPIIGLDTVYESMHIYVYAKNYLGYQELLKIDYLKDNMNLSYLENSNLLVIIPFKSIDIYEKLKYKDNVYIGFCNDIEKNNALLISDKIVYVDNVRCLFKKDISYLKYLKMLNDNFVYNDNAYYKTSSFEDIQTTYEFSKQINLEIPFDKKYIPKYNNSDNNSPVTGTTKDLVEYAKKHVGTPYVWGGSNLSSGVDCSGFTMAVFSHFGVELPHYAHDQSKMGTTVNGLSNAQPGDLLFFDWGGDGNYDHVAIYLGDNQKIHASGDQSCRGKTANGCQVKIDSNSMNNVKLIKRVKV